MRRWGQMPRIRIGAQELYYAARGESGAPLVFIHGAGGSHLEWNGQMAALSDAARTFALDLPGHGRSVGAGRTTIGEYAAALLQFLDGVGIERAVLVGSSMGGAIALTVAMQAPARVKGLVLVGTGAKLRVAPQILDGLQNEFEATARKLVDLYYADTGNSSLLVLKQKSLQQLLKSGSVVTHGDFVACDAFDVRARLGEIRAPTLVVCGDEDRMTPLKYSEYLAEQVAGARLAVIKGTGHMVMLEDAEEFQRVLREWVRENSLL